MLFLFILAVPGALPGARAAGRHLTAALTDSPPRMDDRAGPPGPEWNAATPVTVRDVVAGIDITLKALHDRENVYIQACFPDPTESRMHRRLVWDPAKQAYRDGPEREDVLVLKWSMPPHGTGLTLHEDTAYTADIWFWKAYRSDHAGYADDKFETYSASSDPYAKAMLSRGGKIFYLARKGDEGDEAARTLLYPDYAGDRAPKYALGQPSGSRADIRARGFWNDGGWTVTFARALDTGHPDDVVLSLSGEHPFGVSRFEIAGRAPEPGAEEPLFGSGEVGQILLLRFAR